MTNVQDNNLESIRGQIIYKGQCIDSNDPMRLGRIRAILRTENTQDREKANENLGKQTYVEWDERDPFVFKPLLPFFVNTPPKVNEFVHLFYNNIRRKGAKDKFYIGGVYSSPTTAKFEKYDSAVTNFDEGSRNKPFEDILDESREKYRYSYSEGIYSNPEDIALYGRGSCDIIIKDNTVLLRAGKNKNYEKGKIPVKNDERAFIQLSKFDYRTLYGKPQKKLIFSFEHAPLKKIVEYNLINSENNSNLFMGDIYIYNLALKEGLAISTADMNINKIIPENSKSLLTTIHFDNKKMLEVIKLVNDVLQGIIDKSLENIINEDTVGITISGAKKFEGGESDYPFYFRPQLDMYNKIGGINPSTNMQQIYNISTLLAGVKIKSTDLSPGYSLVYDEKKSDTVPFKPVPQELIPSKTERYNKSVGIVGSDEIYLLSHKSKNSPNKNRIDLSDTIYGIDENMIADLIEPNTSSLVRGEELIELLNLIVKFLVSHVHPYHGTVPVPTSYSGTKVDDILQELLTAQDKILNKKIRIN